MPEGKSIGRYPHNRARDIEGIGALAAFVLLATIIFVPFQLLDIELPYEPLFLLMIAGLVAAGLAAGLMGAYHLWQNAEIELLEDGLRYTTRRGAQFWRWEEVEGVRWVRPRVLPAHYALTANGRRVLVIDERFQRTSMLVQQIHNIVEPPLPVEEWISNAEIPEGEVERDEDFYDDDEEAVDELPYDDTLEVSLLRRTSLFPVIMAVLGLFVWASVFFPAIPNALSDGLINLGWLIASAVTLTIPLLTMRVLLREWRYLFENPRYTADTEGLHLTMRSGTASWKWDEIDEVRTLRTYEWLRPVTFGLAIKVNGKPIAVLNDRYRNVVYMQPYIKYQHETLTKSRYPERMARGEPLSFGAVTLDQTGLTYSGRKFAWSEIGSYDMPYIGGETMFVLYNRDNRRLMSTPTDSLTHLGLMLEMLNERLKLI